MKNFSLNFIYTILILGFDTLVLCATGWFSSNIVRIGLVDFIFVGLLNIPLYFIVKKITGKTRKIPFILSVVIYYLLLFFLLTNLQLFVTGLATY